MKSNSKIAFFTQHRLNGGAEVIFSEISKSWMKKGFVVDWYMLNYQVSKEYASSSNNDYLLSIKNLLRTIISGNKYDLIVCTNHISLIYGYIYVLLNFRRKVSIFTPIMQTRMFCSGELFGISFLCRFFNEVIPNDLKVFGNEACKIEHQRYLKADISSSPVIPVFFDYPTTNYNYKKRATIKKVKLISIGRFVDFKTYNLTLIDVVHKLCLEGYQVSLDFIGDGPLKSQMESLIDKYKMSSVIKILPPISKKDFFSTLQNYDIFIGSGLAVMEASAFGMLAIPAIEYRNADCVSYGYIGSFDSLSLFEPNLNHKEFFVFDMIQDFLDNYYNEKMLTKVKVSQSFLLNNFKQENVIEKYNILLEKMCEKSHPATITCKSFLFLLLYIISVCKNKLIRALK